MKRLGNALVALAAVAASVAVSQASLAGVSAGEDPGFLISNPCAVFNDETDDPNVTRIVYGEPIMMDVRFNAVAVLESSGSGLNLKFQITSHGDGVGQNSGIEYVFNGKASVKANTNDVSRFKGSFSLDARLIGKGNAASQGTLAQGAQDNAVLHYKVSINYNAASETLDVLALETDFRLECVGSPWANQMTAQNLATKTPVGRGFGDLGNKYAWAMRDFNGGMFVGTKNASFDILDLINSPDEAVDACVNNPAILIPAIYKVLACAELYDSVSGSDPSATTDFAEIWRFDYAKKRWSRIEDSSVSQGYRVMTTHGGKLYAGSDLGSFVAGIKLGSIGDSDTTWEFPGVELRVSSDGQSFISVACDTTDAPTLSPTPPFYSSAPLSPCHNNGDRGAFPSVDVNVSIRSLASFNNKLYVGTFNFQGAELWELDGTTWNLVQKFPRTVTGVTELRVRNGSLMVGLGGVTNSSVPGNISTTYLRTMDTSGNLTPVSGLPSAEGTLGVLKLFVDSKNTLFIGLADVTSGDSNGAGFEMHSWNGSTFTPVTLNGFGNPTNAYAWSMNEMNGRLLIGTFNADFFDTVPRGSAELWYSDDGGTMWQQMAMPLDWGLWNYGIRNLEIGNKQLFLGSASNIVAPDLMSYLGLPLSPGAEVWTVKAAAVAPKRR